MWLVRAVPCNTASDWLERPPCKACTLWRFLLIAPFIQAISIAPLQVHYSEALLTQDEYCAGVSLEAPQASASERLPQGPYMYMAARAGFEPATFWTKGAESTNEPPCHWLTLSQYIVVLNKYAITVIPALSEWALLSNFGCQHLLYLLL